MVFIRVLCALAVLTGSVAGLGGCGQSLFDAHGDRGDDGGGDDGGGDDDGSVPVTCPAGTCIADAAADWNGQQGGADGDWHYFDDRRDRTWKAMTPAPGGMDGEAGSQIRLCRDQPANAACRALPGALFVSTAGTPPDPAIEFTSGSTQVIQLAFHARAESAAHRVHLYRNSREDLLVRAEATPGKTASGMIAVDALPGDRFLIALEPSASPDGGGAVALQLFVIDQRQEFPQTCELAVTFTEALTSDAVADRCRGAQLLSKRVDEISPPVPPTYNTTAAMPKLSGGPFSELGSAADLAAQASTGVTTGYFYESGRVLPKGDELTVQLWVRHDGPVDHYDTSLDASGAWMFSDLDVEEGGGLGLEIYGTASRTLEVRGYAAKNALRTQTTPYPFDGAWHFIRMVFTGGEVSVCLDGIKVMGLTLPAAALVSPYAPMLGKYSAIAPPYGAYFDGGLDDARVFSVALPCE
ncbi:MAG TPA: LamG-like jellyroll fold domain-containing protein [Kofleriaceae bacterium]|nr:LamG-like jellyroll fold domain-containing protein [Kofleriaceae bacterium]